MPSPLAVGLLGLLSGFTSGLKEREGYERGEEIRKQERQDRLQKEGQERTDKIIAQNQEYDIASQTLGETKRKNIASEKLEESKQGLEREKFLANDTTNDIMAQVTRRDIEQQGQIQRLLLQNETLSQMNQLIRANKEGKGETPEQGAQEFLSKAYLKLLENPSVLRQPELFAKSIEDAKGQAFQIYGTLGNPAADTVFKQNLNNLVGGTIDPNNPATETGGLPPTGQPLGPRGVYSPFLNRFVPYVADLYNTPSSENTVRPNPNMDLILQLLAEQEERNTKPLVVRTEK